MSSLLWIGIGGFLGAISRFLISGAVNRMTGSGFPYGTMAVNVIGSFMIGFLFLYFENHASSSMRALLVTGLLGALTTFSTFSLETVLLLQEQFYMKAGINILLNVAFSLMATILAMLVYRKFYGI